jgi:hypothetical protein
MSLNQALYSPAVSRAYYSVVQLLLHTIYHNLKVPKEKFETDRKYNNKGSHLWASNLIQIELGKVNREDFKKFHDLFPAFQKLREKADYEDVMISQL